MAIRLPKVLSSRYTEPLPTVIPVSPSTEESWTLALPEPVSLVLEPEPLVPLLLVRPPQLRNPMLQ